MLFQVMHHALREDSFAVFGTLSSNDVYASVVKIDILDKKLDASFAAQSSAIEHHLHEPMGARELAQYPRYLVG